MPLETPYNPDVDIQRSQVLSDIVNSLVDLGVVDDNLKETIRAMFSKGEGNEAALQTMVKRLEEDKKIPDLHAQKEMLALTALKVLQAGDIEAARQLLSQSNRIGQQIQRTAV